MAFRIRFGGRARRSPKRARSANILTIIGLSAVFGLTIAAGVYFRHEPGSGLMSAFGIGGGLMGSGDGHASASSRSTGEGKTDSKAEPLVGAASLAPDDPVMRFSDTRTGQVVFATAGSDNCTRLLFNNKTGTYADAKSVFCGREAEAEPAKDETRSRMDALSSSFRK